MGNFFSRLFGSVLTKAVVDAALQVALGKVQASLAKTDKFNDAEKVVASQAITEFIAQLEAELFKTK